MPVFGGKSSPSKLHVHLAVSWAWTEAEVVTKCFFTTNLPWGQEKGAPSGLWKSKCKLWGTLSPPHGSLLQEPLQTAWTALPTTHTQAQMLWNYLFKVLKHPFLISVLYTQSITEPPRRGPQTYSNYAQEHICITVTLMEHVCANFLFCLDLPFEFVFLGLHYYQYFPLHCKSSYKLT